MVTKFDEKQIAIILVVLSSVLGFLVHPFYDWTGSDQSRPSPLLWRVPLIIASLLALICLALPWLKIPRADESGKPFRFKLGQLLMATAGAIVVAVVVSRLPPLVACFLVLAMAIMIIMTGIRDKQYLAPTAAMFGVMYLPYLWLAFHFEFDADLPESLGMLLGLPGFLPSLFVSRMVGQHISESSWLPPLITSGMLAIGFVLIRVGPRVTLVYFCLLLMVSLIGSLGLNAALRI